jgi:hypothetical protein
MLNRLQIQQNCTGSECAGNRGTSNVKGSSINFPSVTRGQSGAQRHSCLVANDVNVHQETGASLCMPVKYPSVMKAVGLSPRGQVRTCSERPLEQ